MNHLVRFGPVLGLIETASRPRGGTLLDVGSGSMGISALLSGWEVTSVDADFADYGAPTTGASVANRLIGDVRALPFDDRQFDVVVAIDLLEHVPPEDRDQAVSEICRVAGTRAVVACPTGADALAGDRRIATRLTAAGRTVPGWLSEHLENKLPEAAQIAAVCSRYGPVTMTVNESVAAHERLVYAEMRPTSAVFLRLLCPPVESLLRSHHTALRQVATSLLKRIRGRDLMPAYRTIASVDIVPQSAQSEVHKLE